MKRGKKQPWGGVFDQGTGKEKNVQREIQLGLGVWGDVINAKDISKKRSGQSGEAKGGGKRGKGVGKKVELSLRRKGWL